MISVKFRIGIRVSFRLVNVFRVKVMVKVRNLCFLLYSCLPCFDF